MNLLLSDPAFLSAAAGVSYDPDAAAYIARVEGASGDNQTLETAVKDAINAFVVGCKADGIWNAIKASCILAGARTLNGALQPLVGTAPTPYNFVSADYNRKTGLVGDASTKYLDSNRAGNADPQNNYHSSVFLSSSTASTQFYIGATPEIALVSSSITMKIPNSARASVGSPTLNFIGGSRNSSSEFSARLSGVTSSFSFASIAPSASNVLLYAGGSALINSNARIAFYSIGESLNLQLLDARVTTLINAFSTAIP